VRQCAPYPGLPDDNFNKKPNNAKKRPEQDQSDCLKSRKKPIFICGIAIVLSQKISKLREYQKHFFKIKFKSCLALYWSTDLPCLFMICEFAQFG